jgi:hypothetical protein
MVAVIFPPHIFEQNTGQAELMHECRGTLRLSKREENQIEQCKRVKKEKHTEIR